jgi:CMD domain protein
MRIAAEDLIDLAAGIKPGSPIDKLRAARRETRLNADKCCHILFDRGDEDASLTERLGLAVFTTALQGGEELARIYTEELSGRETPALLSALKEELASITASRITGPVYTVSPKNRSLFGSRLGAALEHAHLLIFHPRDAKAENIRYLLDAGWSARGTVIISQIIAFLAYQVRLVRGLRILQSSLKEE